MARILVIDDEMSIRSLLRKVLERAGHQVAEAVDGEEGLALYRQAPTDLVITDVFMPRKDGVETIADLRRDDPEVKIIAMTAHGERESYNFLRVAEALGAAHTLEKPFAIDDVLTAVKTLLDT